jgi:hypothetical protein
MAVAATFPGAPALASTLDQRTLIEGLAAHGRHRCPISGIAVRCNALFFLGRLTVV